MSLVLRPFMPGPGTVDPSTGVWDKPAGTPSSKEGRLKTFPVSSLCDTPIDESPWARWLLRFCVADNPCRLLSPTILMELR